MQTLKMKEIIKDMDPSLFVPMKTKTKIDDLFSSDGGIMPATNIMVTGDPGVGKSTVLLDVLAELQRQGKKVLYLNAEMDRFDMVGYVKRYPKFDNIDILFLLELEDGIKHEDAIKKQLSYGYDVVLVDSWAELVELIKSTSDEKKSVRDMDSNILKILRKHNSGDNMGKCHTSFLLIQQVTKGGKFVGSNRLKHMITAMVHLKFNKNQTERYIHYSKNRRGGLPDKFYFSLRDSGNVNYYRTEAFDEED